MAAAAFDVAQLDVPTGSVLVLPHNATLDGEHQARCDGTRLIGLVRKDSSVWLEAVAEEAAVAAMQAFSAVDCGLWTVDYTERPCTPLAVRR